MQVWNAIHLDCDCFVKSDYFACMFKCLLIIASYSHLVAATFIPQQMDSNHGYCGMVQ